MRDAISNAKLILVTGKGGTGKSTVSAAIGQLLARQGKRVLVAEVDTDRSALAPIYGIEPTFEPVEADQLHISNILWKPALERFLRGIVPAGPVVRAVLSNKTLMKFFDFFPGSQEMVTLSRIDQLAEKWDVVVVDMPASGHAFGLVDILRSALQVFRGGPMRKRATEMLNRVTDDDTQMVFVALPEEMVVNETIETIDRFRLGEYLGRTPVVLLNRAQPLRLTAEVRTTLDSLPEDLPTDAAEFVSAVRRTSRLEGATVAARERLKSAGVFGELNTVHGDPRSVVEQLADQLESAWS